MIASGQALGHACTPNLSCLHAKHLQHPLAPTPHPHPHQQHQQQQHSVRHQPSRGHCCRLSATAKPRTDDNDQAMHSTQPPQQPLQLTLLSSRRAALLAGLGLVVGCSDARAEGLETVAAAAEGTSAPVPPPPAQDATLLRQLMSKLPPLADRPGASGKQLLVDPVEFTYAFTSEVPCDLRVKQYYQLIVRNRPKCWQRIASQIQASAFTELDEGLKQGAMADLRQAALYVPWALLQRDDYVASVEVRKGYLSLNAHIQDLQNAALTAAENNTSADRVQQAFILMSASLDEFLSRVPNRYKDGPQGAQD